jgi:predicted DNA-binding ribbon-helix-helix protein
LLLLDTRPGVSLEDAFWQGLRKIAKARGQTLSGLIASIDSDRQYGGNGNLSSAIRLFVLGFYLDQSDPRNGTRERFAARG